MIISFILLVAIAVAFGLWFIFSNRESPMESISSGPGAQTLPPQKGDSIITLETTYGVIKFKLFPELTPETAKNFIELSKKGFYDGLLFHRVIKDFMIQGGDPLGNGTGGETYKGPGTVLPDEISLLRHIRGALSMANRGPNTGTSQFFIVQAAAGTPWLDSKHTVFGQVFEGMDIIDAIANTAVGASDRPVNPVKIIKAEVGVY